MTVDLELESGSLERYLVDRVLPFWLEHGRDLERGGWHLFLGPDLEPSPESDFRRCVVQSRQLYSLSLAYRHEPRTSFRSAIDESLEHLFARFEDRDHGGWFFTTNPDGSVREDWKDPYAHAFVLLGLATCHHATGDARVLKLAQNVRSLIETRFRAPGEAGFQARKKRDWQPIAPPPDRQQNPHMHLLEAYCALYEGTRDRSLLDSCREIVGMLRERFIDPETSTLGEFFDQDWKPLPGEEGARVEPGHHFEWTWLLYRYSALSGDESCLDLADQLYSRGIEHGLTPDGASAVDCIDRAGNVTDPRQRVWPQTELLKALAARWEVRGDRDARERLGRVLEKCAVERIDPETGAWREQIGADGSVIDTRYYASSVYHIALAISELVRVTALPTWKT